MNVKKATPTHAQAPFEAPSSHLQVSASSENVKFPCVAFKFVFCSRSLWTQTENGKMKYCKMFLK